MAGEPANLAELYDRYAPMVIRMAYRLLGSRQDAEDVLHDLFVGLPERLRSYQEQGQFAAWLRRVVLRMALMRLRKVRHRREVPLDTLPIQSESVAPTDPRRMDLERAINRLPSALRIVFVLRQLEGYCYEEIAAELRISPGAARVRYARAIGLLRRSVEEQ